MNSRPRTLLALLLSPLSVAAQSGSGAAPPGGKQDQDPAAARKQLAAASAAALAWVAADPAARERTAKSTVDELMAAGRPGLGFLAAQLRDSADPKRTDRWLDLVGLVARRWLVKVERSEMVFAGQYDDLKVLMPEVGEFYFRLLLRTPVWFSSDQRVKVIAPLRDLYPKGPDEPVLDEVIAVAQNDADEPESLRTALAYALAQWGRRNLIREKLRAMEQRASSADPETAILGYRDLAQTYYDIRDYTQGAVAHQEHIRRAEAAGGYDLKPVHYYNTACCLCLSGDRRSALSYLQRCLDLNKSPRIDSSVRLKRKLFERDPEIALLRDTKGFQAMLDQAFGQPRKAPGEAKRER